MKVLITGAAGFLGYHLTHYLFEKGDEVLGLDIAEFPAGDYPESMKKYQIDVRDKQKLEELIKKEIKNILTENITTATSKDQLTQNVEKQLSGLHNIQTDTQSVSNIKVIGDLVSKKEDTDRVVDSLIENGEIKTVKDKNSGKLQHFRCN